MFKYPMLLTKKEDDHRGANKRAQERQSLGHAGPEKSSS